MNDPGTQFIELLDDAKLRALIETMYLVAFADGDYGPAERQLFARSVDYLTAGRVHAEAFDPIIDELVDQIGRIGRDGCVESIKRRLDDPVSRQVALILAHDMAAADGVLHPSERALLESFARSFGMGHELTREVLDGPSPARDDALTVRSVP